GAFCDQLQGDDAAGAGAIVYDDLLPQLLAQPGSDYARLKISGSAGRKRDHQPQWSSRIVSGGCRDGPHERGERYQQPSRNRTAFPFSVHWLSSIRVTNNGDERPALYVTFNRHL